MTVVAQERMDATSAVLMVSINFVLRPADIAMQLETLQTLPLFQGLSPSDLNLLTKRFDLVTFPANHIVFEQGDRAERLYVLISGRVAIRFKPDDGEVLNVTEIEENGVFGWSAALGRRVYTSCALCLEECEALYVRGDELRKLCETHPKTGVIILERLAEVIAERLRSTHAQVVELLRLGIQPKAAP